MRDDDDDERDDVTAGNETAAAGKAGKSARRPAARPRARPRTEAATTSAQTERRLRQLGERLGADGGAGYPNQRSQGMVAADRFDLMERRRRQSVLDLWARGYNAAAIARSLDVSRGVVVADIRYLQSELQRDILPDLHQRLSRAATVRMTVQTEAWQLYTRLEDKAHNKVSALELVLKAQDGLDKLTGVSSPEEVNAAALVEMQQATMEALLAVGGVEAQQAFTRYLREKATLGFNPLQLPAMPEDVEVESDYESDYESDAAPAPDRPE